jgi:pimeloyl-ACP methyl ester carboxylesterase
MGHAVTTLDSGSGPRIVFVPGTACGHSSFAPVVSRLPGYATRSVVLAGFAGTPRVEAPLLSRAIDELVALGRAGGPFAIVGHSLGVPLAIEVAAALPEHVRCVVAVDGVPALGPFVHRTTDRGELEAIAERERARRVADDAFYPRILGQLRAQCRLASSFEAIEADARTSAPAAIVDALCELLLLDARPALAAMASPILVVLGEWARAPSDALDRLLGQVAAARSLRVEAIAGADHFVMVDRPDEFVRIVEPFIATHLARG